MRLLHLTLNLSQLRFVLNVDALFIPFQNLRKVVLSVTFSSLLGKSKFPLLKQNMSIKGIGLIMK